MFKKALSLTVIFCFFLTTLAPLPKAHADTVLGLPQPGTMVNLSPAYVPVIVKGLRVHPENPVLFDFIVDTGNTGLLANDPQLKAESEKLIKYFLASLTIPEDDLWVNLSPYEKDRMVPEQLGRTEMGRDMLAQDYMLKQITASLIYPEKDLGKEFWSKVYAKAQEQYGTNEIPVNTFNKVWIVADKAKVYVHANTAFVVASHLKVMLEEDYLALSKHQRQPGDMASAVSPSTSPSELPLNVKAPQGNNPHALPSTSTLSSQIIREIVLPALEGEVNTGQNFANLRQIFHSMILAAWYKKNLKEALLNQVYSNKAKINGIERSVILSPKGEESQQNLSPEQIYQQYLKAYKKGVFNYIKEDIQNTQTVPRKYFSGGEVFQDVIRNLTETYKTTDRDVQGFTVDGAMVNVFFETPEATPIRDLQRLYSETSLKIKGGDITSKEKRRLRKTLRLISNAILDHPDFPRRSDLAKSNETNPAMLGDIIGSLSRKHHLTQIEAGQLKRLTLADRIQREVFGVNDQDIDKALDERIGVFNKTIDGFHQLMKAEKINDMTDEKFWSIYVPLSLWMYQRKMAKRPNESYNVGFYGNLGIGKTTRTKILTMVLSELLKSRGEQVIAWSEDDLYKRKAERELLRPAWYKGKVYRGPPGTHDVDLGVEVFKQLRHTTSDSVVQIPVFKKEIDDRVSPREVHGKVGIVIFEGWIAGTYTNVDPARILDPFKRQNALALQKYAPLNDQLDDLIVRKTHDIDTVRKMYTDQVRRQRAAVEKAGGTWTGIEEEEIDPFIDLFYKDIWEPGVTSPEPRLEDTSILIDTDAKRGIISMSLGGRAQLNRPNPAMMSRREFGLKLTAVVAGAGILGTGTYMGLRYFGKKARQSGLSDPNIMNWLIGLHRVDDDIKEFRKIWVTAATTDQIGPPLLKLMDRVTVVNENTFINIFYLTDDEIDRLALVVHFLRNIVPNKIVVLPQGNSPNDPLSLLTSLAQNVHNPKAIRLILGQKNTVHYIDGLMPKDIADQHIIYFHEAIAHNDMDRIGRSIMGMMIDASDFNTDIDMKNLARVELQNATIDHLSELLKRKRNDPKLIRIFQILANYNNSAAIKALRDRAMSSSGTAMAVEPVRARQAAKANPNGGIDLNARNMGLDVRGEKTDVRFDKAIIGQFKRGDFSGVRPVIIKITPIADVMPLLGLKDEDRRLAGV